MRQIIEVQLIAGHDGSNHTHIDAVLYRDDATGAEAWRDRVSVGHDIRSGGHKYYSIGDDGARARVEAFEQRQTIWIRTVGDFSEPDNLLKLPLRARA